MLGLKGGILDGSEDVFSFEKRVIRKNLFERSPGAQQVQYIRYTYPQTANTRAPATLARLKGNPLK